MSFGRRSAGGEIVQQVPIRAHPSADDGGVNVHPAIAMAFLAGIAMLLLAGSIYFASPFTYSADRVWYSRTDIVVANLAPLMTEEQRLEAQRRLSADFSLILRPAAGEQSRATKEVVDICLPPGARAFSMPGEMAHTYQLATEYLLCAMTIQPKRLCHPAERKHLVAQLLQYKDRKQNVIAVYREIREVLSNPMTQLGMTLEDRVNGTKGRVEMVNELLQKQWDTGIDPRILEAIAKLNRAGLLTASDFWPLGLYLPSEYAPVLRRSEAGTPSC